MISFTDTLSVSEIHSGIFGDSLTLTAEWIPGIFYFKTLNVQLGMINEQLFSTLKTGTEHVINHDINIAKMQLFYETVNYLWNNS